MKPIKEVPLSREQTNVGVGSSPKSKKPSTITEDSIDSESEEQTPVQIPKKKHSSVNINLKRVKRNSIFGGGSEGKTPMNQTESGSLYSDMP